MELNEIFNFKFEYISYNPLAYVDFKNNIKETYIYFVGFIVMKYFSFLSYCLLRFDNLCAAINVLNSNDGVLFLNKNISTKDDHLLITHWPVRRWEVYTVLAGTQCCIPGVPGNNLTASEGGPNSSP